MVLITSDRTLNPKGYVEIEKQRYKEIQIANQRKRR